MNKEDRVQLKIESLPGNLKEALAELAKSDLIKSALGSHVYEKFHGLAMYEWKEYSKHVSQWELDNYLKKF